MEKPEPIDGDIWTPEETAAVLKETKGKLAVWRHRTKTTGKLVGPPFVMLAPRSPRYVSTAVMAWLAAGGHMRAVKL